MTDPDDQERPGEPADAQWEQTMSEFQSIEAPSLELTAAVRRGRAKLVRGWIIGALIWLGTSALGLRVWLHEQDLAAAIFALMQIGIPGWIFFFVWRSQRAAWAPLAETTRAFLAVELERRSDFARRMRFVRARVMPVMLALTLVWHALLVARDPRIVSPLTLAGVAGFGGAYVILAGIWVFAGRKLARFEAEADGLRRRLVELGPPS